MNNKLPRLVLVGLGTVAVAVVSIFSGKNLRASSPSSGSGLDVAAFEIAGCSAPWPYTCPTPIRTPTVATSVRG